MPKTEGLSNPFRLPRGERLRREIVAVFAEQRRRILSFLRTGRKDQQADPLPFHWPAWHDFGLGALEVSRRMTPLLRLTWEAAADKFAPQVGLDPNVWSVVNPHTERAIQDAALAFSDSMNRTTSLSLDNALEKTREALHEGVIEKGEALPELTKRINAIFDGATKSRARRIAWTETSRAMHQAQEAAAIASGVVTGWEWLISADACPVCVAIAARARTVRLGHTFAVIGESAHYSQIKFPPAHPHCNCSVTEILDTDPQPQWHDTLHQPEPATDEEVDQVAREIAERDERTQRGSSRPKPAARPKPAPPKPKPDPAATMPVQRFATEVQNAARSVPIEERYTDVKVWISDAFTQFERIYPGTGIATFKRRLADANAERLITLARSDMPHALRKPDRIKEAESEMSQGPAVFHWIRLPNP